MHFFKALAVGAATVIAMAAAQSSTLGFTQVPSSVTAGKATVIKYDAENNEAPVTITLRKGDPNNLSTISTLTTTATGGSYTWIPSDSLEDGDDYALEIQQGNDSNYSGEFSLSGSNASAVSSAMSVTSSSLSSASSLTASTLSPNATMTGTVTGGATGSSHGTGIPMTRNTTMSSATLRSTQTSVQTVSASTTSGAGFQGTQTSSAGPSSTSNAAMSTNVFTGSSPLALVLCAIAAIVY